MILDNEVSGIRPRRWTSKPSWMKTNTTVVSTDKAEPLFYSTWRLAIQTPKAIKAWHESFYTLECT